MRQVIARWESKRGKDWVEVYKDDYGYGYTASGGGGWFGDATEEQALANMQRQIEAGCWCSQKTPMKRVEV